jgi:hypothetical protein
MAKWKPLSMQRHSSAKRSVEAGKICEYKENFPWVEELAGLETRRGEEQRKRSPSTMTTDLILYRRSGENDGTQG